MTGFLQWLSQPQNSTLVLVVITGLSVGLTGVYVVLTYSMSRAVSHQTAAMLQPAVMLNMDFIAEQPDAYGQRSATMSSMGSFKIQNVGAQPIVLLNVRIECWSGGKRVRADEFAILEEHVLYPASENDRIMMQFSFADALSSAALSSRDYSYSFRVVAADMSHHVVVEYELLPVLGTRYFRNGMPLPMRWKRIKQRLGWRVTATKRLLKLEKSC